jgi:lipoyl(octanoyl) transferase
VREDIHPQCEVHMLSAPVPYADALALQQDYAAERGQNRRDDTLLLLQHPHVYTLGSAASTDHLLLSAEERVRRGIAVHRADRGGDITYHGPGQIVGYPIVKLASDSSGLRADVVAYIRALEAVIIKALARFDIPGERLPGFSGVWVLAEDGTLTKIAAIGVKVTVRCVTYHGFALNVNPDMSLFEGIVPCGIADKPVISMQQYMGHSVSLAEVHMALIDAFGAVFERHMVPIENLSGI